MPIKGLKPTSCDDIGVALRTLKARLCVSMDIRVDLAKETARPRLFLSAKNDPAPRAVERAKMHVALPDLALVERHDREARPLVLRRGFRVGALRRGHGHWRYAQLVQIAARVRECRYIPPLDTN